MLCHLLALEQTCFQNRICRLAPQCFIIILVRHTLYQKVAASVILTYCLIMLQF